METTTIKEFNGYRYDSSKLAEIDERISDNESIIFDINEQYADEKGIYNHYSICRLCGKIIVHSHDGYGSKCYETIKNLIPVVARISPDFKDKLDQYNLKKWITYANTIRRLYIGNNTDKDGNPKKFRSEFKKSFFNSIQKAERISRKQIDVMTRDLFNTDYYTEGGISLDYNDKNAVLSYFNNDSMKELAESWHELIESDNSVTLFAQITYKNAWLDNPLKNEKVHVESD